MIGFAGLSHLGLVSSLAAAKRGFDIVGYDPEPALVDAAATGRFRVTEPGLSECHAEVRDRVRYTGDLRLLAGCDLIYVAVDVPTDAQNRSDTTPVRALVQQVIGAAAPGTTVVVLSQVAPGFTRALQPLARDRGCALLYQVETLIFGRAVERALFPERFIVGLPDPATAVPPALSAFLSAFGCPILPMRLESAELCKISINMFLVASVQTTNMLAELCEAIGAEWREIAPALRLDRRIGEHAYLTPGLGIGGGNLTRDLATIDHLAGEYGTDAQLVATWLSHSDYRRDWVLRRLHQRVLAGRSDARIAMWGLTYKEHTRSTKNSPAVALLERLGGRVRTRAFDPEAAVDPADAARWGIASTALDACDGADALVVMTPWPQFAREDLREARRRMGGDVLLDPHGCLDPAGARAAGFRYDRLGSGAAAV